MTRLWPVPCPSTFRRKSRYIIREAHPFAGKAPGSTSSLAVASACAALFATTLGGCASSGPTKPTEPQSATLAAPAAPATTEPETDGNAPASASAPTGKPGRVVIDKAFFIPGEQMFWTVSMRGITGLQATMVVGEPGRVAGRNVVVVRSQAQTAGVVNMVKAYFEEATTNVDVATATPMSRRAIERYDGREIVINSRFSGDAVEHTRQGDKPRTWQQSMPAGEPIYDNQTILGLVRAWEPEQAGARGYFYAVTDEMLHRHAIRFTGFEEVNSALGLRHARRYDVDVHTAASYGSGTQRSDQSYTLWISDDIARMPLLLAIPHRYGRIEMALVAYSRPHPSGTGNVVIRAEE